MTDHAALGWGATRISVCSRPRRSPISTRAAASRRIARRCSVTRASVATCVLRRPIATAPSPSRSSPTASVGRVVPSVAPWTAIPTGPLEATRVSRGTASSTSVPRTVSGTAVGAPLGPVAIRWIGAPSSARPSPCPARRSRRAGTMVSACDRWPTCSSHARSTRSVVMAPAFGGCANRTADVSTTPTASVNTALVRERDG